MNSFGRIVINEVMPKPSVAATACDQTMVNASSSACGKEYVEIYNTDPCNAVDISCYIIASKTQNGNLSVGINIGGAFALPSGTIIPPLGHIVVGGPNASVTAASVDFVLANYIGQPNLCIENPRWFLENTAGWIALYNSTGSVVDAIYWTFSAGNPNLLNTDAEFSYNPCTPASCGTLPTLKSAKQMTVGTEISYVQDVTNTGLTFSRIPDGGAWQRNINPSIAGTNNCNGGTCNTPTLISFNATVTQPTCGNNNGSITLNVTSAGAITFSWLPVPSPAPTNTATSTSASGLGAGSYKISVTQNGCTKDTTIVLSPTGKPNAGVNQTTCAGTTATLTGTVPTTGTWSSQAGNPAGATIGSTTGGIATVTFNAGAGGTYNFIYTSSGCTDTMSVIVNAKPNAGANQTGICAGTSVSLTGTSPTTGTWTAQTGNPAGATLGSTTAGAATVALGTNATGLFNFIYTANGCSDTMSVTVIAKPNAGVDQTVACFSTDNATMAGTGTGTWTIGGGSAGTASITNNTSPTTTITTFSSAGNYNLVWTSNGCSDTAKITVNSTCVCTLPLTLSLNKTDNSICSTAACTYTGPAVLINELLIDKSGENTIIARSNLSAGAEWVELYNPNPCQALDLSCYMLGNYSTEAGTVFEPAILFFPPGTSIPPLGFLTIGGANSGADKLPAANLPGFIGNRFYLPGGVFEGGWIGIWDPNGVTVDAVYWMDASRNINSGVATASFTTSPGTVTNANVPFSCPYRGTLPTARTIANTAGPITRIGNIASDSKFAFRNVDAGAAWTFNGNTGTQGACNSTCVPPFVSTCNGTATVNVTSGAPGPYTYQWDAAAGSQTTQTATNLCAGNYCVTVKDATGNCIKTECITVNTTKPNAGINLTTCAGTSATLTGTNPTTGTWSAQTGNPAGATLGSTTGGVATVSFAASAAGVYNFIYTANGCTDTMNVTITTKPNAGVNQTGVCAGTSVTLTGTSPTTGTWTAQTGNPAGATLGSSTGGVSIVSFAASASGVYNFIYSANGCSDTMNVSVTAKPNAGIDQTVSCFITGTATMAGTGTGTWTIGGGSAGTATITGNTNPTTTITTFSAAGNYNLVWTNNGCSDTARITVNNSCSCPIANNNLTAPASPNCAPYNGTTINGSTASPAGGTYLWQYNNGGPFSNASGTNNTEDYTTGVLPAGTHQFRRIYTTTSGIICSDTSNIVTIIVNDLPTANAGADKVITCSNPSTLLNGSSSTAGVSYSWTGPGIVSGGNTATPTVNATGAYTLTVTVIATGCKQTDIADVTSSGAIPNVNAGTDKTLTCTQTSVVLNGSSSTSGVSYSWTGPGFVNGGNTATPTVNANGTYILTVTITATGCQNSDQVDVISNITLPNANAGSDKILTCSVTDVILNGSSTTLGVSYSWNGPGIVSGGNTATPRVNTAGTYTLTVTNTSNGCTKTDQVDVTSSGTLPNANAGIDKNISCVNPTVTLGGITTANITFSWTGPGIISGSNTSTPIVNAAGIYTLTVTDIATGCKNTDQAVVTSTTTPPNITIQNPIILTCTITSTTLTAISNSTNLTYIWTGPGIVSGQSSFNPTVNAAGTYALTVRDSVNGCTASTTVNVVADTTVPVISINASKNPADYNDIINLSVNTNAVLSAILWQPSSLLNDSTVAQVSVQITEPTTFIVSVKDNKGCTNTAKIFIRVNQVECIYLPNTFTPDGNNRNETYKPLGTKLKSMDVLRIFDRWGNLVFETTDINQGWDGTYNGKLLEPGVYVYYIEGTCITNNKEFIKGDVTLIR